MMRALSMLAILLAMACGDSSSGGAVEGAACRNSSDCEDGLLCRLGSCARSCNTATDCGSNQACVDGACAVNLLDSLGAACSSPERCASGFCVDDVCCESACDGPCEACGSAGACDEVPVDDAMCGVLDCDGLDSDCRDYHDVDAERCAGLGVCKPPNDEGTCTAFSDAPAGSVCTDDGLCTERDACDGGGNCIPGAVALCGSPALVRYWIAEATAGQPVGTSVLDEQTPSLDLPITYAGASPAYALGPYGDRGLLFSGADGMDTGGAQAAVAGTKLAPLEGASRVTFEVKYATHACSNENTVLFGIDGAGGELFVGQVGGEDRLVVHWQGEPSWSRYSLGVGCPVEAAAVVHWVIDTSEAVAEERVRAYIDGVRQTVTPFESDFPASGAAITLGTDAMLKIGRPGAPAALHARVWYAALYGTALEPTAIWANAARLNANDDRRVSHGVISKSIGTGPREFATLSAWEAARQGGLPTRVVLAVRPLAGRFEQGETVAGEGGCQGTYVLEDQLATNAQRMSLDDWAGGCAAGALMTGATSGATARLEEVVIDGGTIERGLTHADSVFTAGLQVAGSQTDADHFFWLTTAAGDRHLGVAGSGMVLDTDALGHVIVVDQAHTRIEWLEITDWPNDQGTSHEAIHLGPNADHTLLQYLLIHDEDWIGRATNPNGDAINLNELADGGTVTIRNTMIYNVSRGGINQQNEPRAITVNVENCTILRTALSGDQADADGGIAINGANPSGQASVANVSNTVVLDSCPDTVVECTRTTRDYDAGWVENTVDPDWGNSHHNVSSDGTAPGTDVTTGVVATDVFVDASYGAEDLHLVAGSPLEGAGSAPTYPTCEDVNLQPRPLGGGWDVGADERP